MRTLVLGLRQFLPTIMSVTLTLLLFWINFRCSIGARKERARAANAELERTVLRQVVQENYTPNAHQLEVLGRGFASDYQVREVDMHLPTVVLSVVCARVSASDFILSDRRAEFLERLSKVIDQAEKTPFSEERLEQEEKAAQRASRLWLSMSVLASILGVLIGYVITGVSPRNFDWQIVGSLSIIILGTILGFLGFYVLQNESAETVESDQRGPREAASFERFVLDRLQKYGAMVERGPSDRGYDAKIIVNGKPVLIEVKNWSSSADMSLQQTVVNRMKELLKKEGASEAWIVVNKPSRKHPVDPVIKFIPADEIPTKLSKGDLRDLINVMFRCKLSLAGRRMAYFTSRASNAS